MRERRSGGGRRRDRFGRKDLLCNDGVVAVSEDLIGELLSWDGAKSEVDESTVRVDGFERQCFEGRDGGQACKLSLGGRILEIELSATFS